MVFITNSPHQTQKVGKTLAKEIKEGDIVGIFGPLGCGKTTLLKGIFKGLGIKKSVRSSSFVLMQEYKLKKVNIYHYDLYRIKDKKELFNLGWPASSFIIFIEWAERVKDFLSFSIRIRLFYEGERRRKIKVEFLR
ncbi:MAG: tRNA (adenosine(37)-N6)-threonylcarbamoyltransferase complex ATPase subunit type 1 TsaE [Candidatus Omnitrophica bacterium 4484_70.1]|nr:MAG: tRNA (adenosine(37)-N6)-threonylcarbamoyltransferase complex ATPase subunit type 1 TsaE [Candidatus Omnitrophica bacterium 4484_70.1]